MTIDPVVVVVRLNSGSDLLAILLGQLEGKLKLEHPHYVDLNSSTGTVSMIPYCALSEEKYYQIDITTVQFAVPATREVSRKFFDLVDSIESKQTRELLEFEQPVEEMEVKLAEKTYISGNDTKH